jgi:hypothetical protein
MDFSEKVKGFLLEPSKTFDASKGDTLNEALKYYVLLAVIFSALLALLFAIAATLFGSMMGRFGMLLGTGAGMAGALVIFVMFLVLWIISAFVSGAILHIFVYIVGGRKGISQTIKAVMYGSTPSLLLGWIPFINYLAWIWSLVLEILGIRQLQELTTGRAILAVLIPIIIIVVLVVVIAAMFATYMFSTGGYYGRGY